MKILTILILTALYVFIGTVGGIIPLVAVIGATIVTEIYSK